MANRGESVARRNYAIFSFGHSGSMWIASALHRPERGMVVFHEPSWMIAGPAMGAEPWFADPSIPVPREGLLRILRSYFEWRARRCSEFPVVGEIHNLPDFYWPFIADRLAPQRCLLVRDGIRTVHSRYYGLLADRAPAHQQVALRATPERYRSRREEERLFAGLCALWAGQPVMAEALSIEQVVRLEDLSGNPAALQELNLRLTAIPLEEEWLSKACGTPINRKVFGDNSPANLFWNLWTDSMRDTFVELCRESMQSLRYEIPARPEQSAERPDDTPRRPQPRPAPQLGPLSPLWIFVDHPHRGPVVVWGEPEIARTAAALLGAEYAWILDDSAEASRSLPGAFRSFCSSDARRLEPVGIFLAHPSPDPAQVAWLESTWPGVELVRMGETTIRQDQLRALQQSGPLGVPRSEVPWVARTTQHPASTAVGPLRVGDTFDGWTIKALRTSRDSLAVEIARGAEVVELDLQRRREGCPSPFPAGDLALYYKDTKAGFASFERAGRRIAAVLRKEATGSSIEALIEKWVKRTT